MLPIDVIAEFEQTIQANPLFQKAEVANFHLTIDQKQSKLQLIVEMPYDFPESKNT